MAGHSQFKNIMHRKGAQDAKRAKVFTKLIRELTVAARSGLPDPDEEPAPARGGDGGAHRRTCPRIRSSVPSNAAAARPTILHLSEKCATKAMGRAASPMIVETLTDNRNRTAAALRTAFAKHGGNLGEAGSVAFQFSRLGVIRYPRERRGSRRRCLTPRPRPARSIAKATTHGITS